MQLSKQFCILTHHAACCAASSLEGTVPGPGIHSNDQYCQWKLPATQQHLPTVEKPRCQSRAHFRLQERVRQVVHADPITMLSQLPFNQLLNQLHKLHTTGDTRQKDTQSHTVVSLDATGSNTKQFLQLLYIGANPHYNPGTTCLPSNSRLESPVPSTKQKS
jgi:hypothetical protein